MPKANVARLIRPTDTIDADSTFTPFSGEPTMFHPMLYVQEFNASNRPTGREWYREETNPREAVHAILAMTGNGAEPIEPYYGSKTWHAGAFSYMVHLAQVR